MISIIIPTLNEERALPATLAAVATQSGDFEVLVVDGGSEDRTERVVEGYRDQLPGLRWLVTGRGRAHQLNAGAERARGNWLLFLHADTELPEGALHSIEGLPADTRAGCFHQRFSGEGSLLSLLSWFHNARFRFTHVIYGDQAMFVRRNLFQELEGFTDRQMEDIGLGLRLRRITRPVILPLTVTTDSRKFDQIGHWRALGRAISLLVRFRLRRDVDEDSFFDSYR